MNDDMQAQTEEAKAEETAPEEVVESNKSAEQAISEAPAEKTADEETEVKSEETIPSPVIASEAEGEAKQSSSDENLTQIASDPTSPRNDEEVDEPTSTTPASAPKDDKKENPNAKWYVVHTYSGHENKVAHTLKQRVESEHLEEKILEVLVPTQDKIEIKGGKKVNVKEKIFPGYILVKMVLDDVSWLAVRTTQGVTSFVGIGNKPTPISDAEVATIVKFTQTEAPMYKQVFMESDTVKIVDGPFADFIGKVDSVDQERGKVKVLVSIFGRETPVELDFLQIQKL